ncbi:MAG: DJ-1/PfpI family protein [Clostridia bacterium]|nr:DJ-1/PfpI family protein [Clostridia bacterium]
MVVVFLANGFEEIEALTPVDFLRRAGAEVVTVAIEEGGAQGREVVGAHGITVLADVAERDFVLPENVEMVVLPGGMPGASNLDESPLIDGVLYTARERGAYLCAICAAPLVLGHRGYLEGIHATCYPGFETELCGGIYEREITVVTDGKIITAPGMGTAQQFGLKLVEVLYGKDRADQLCRSVMTPGI